MIGLGGASVVGVDAVYRPLDKKINNRKGKTLSTQKNPNGENDKEKELEMEIIDEKDMSFVRRGRKSNISDKEIEMVKELANKNIGKWIKFSSYAMPKELTDAKDKKNYQAKVGATIRGIAKRIGMENSIRWDKGIVPCVRFTKVTK